MAQDITTSVKHLQIDKANKTVIIAVSVAVVVLIFGLFIGRGMLQRLSHRQAVIAEKEKALTTLSDNIKARDEVVKAYEAFLTEGTGADRNIIGGNNDELGAEPNDGSNARIVLDALPSKYDFPALVTSIQTLLGQNYKVDSIKGEDLEVEQSAVEPSSNPQVVEIPIEFEIIESDYAGVTRAVELLQSSIRPFRVNTITISGENDDLSLEVNMLTYYKPEKILGISEKVVR